MGGCLQCALGVVWLLQAVYCKEVDMERSRNQEEELQVQEQEQHMIISKNLWWAAPFLVLAGCGGTTSPFPSAFFSSNMKHQESWQCLLLLCDNMPYPFGEG